MKNNTIIDALIGDIKTDQGLLSETDKKMEKLKEEKREIADRLKEYRRDVSVLLKYVDDTKRKELEELGFEFSDPKNGLNPIASRALEIIMNAKDNQLTNGELYDAYLKTFKNPEDAFGYSDFNIKCRPLFNSQRLLRKKGKDPKSSRDDIIYLNGRTTIKK